MARQLRVEYKGAIYHLMSRGDRNEPIFSDDEDRRRFVGTLGEACAKAGWQVHAYCLMGNHFHLVVETPQPTLVSGMKWFLGTYTQRFNARHQLRGHLFAGRYKALLVDGSEDSYLRVVCNYVHLNPVRCGLIDEGKMLEDFEWSSYPQYLKLPRGRAKWLRVDRLMGELGIFRDNGNGRRQFREYMKTRCREENHSEEALWSRIRRGWRFGAEDFLERLLELGAAPNADPSIHGGGAVAETMEEKAKQLIGVYLKKRNIKLEKLRGKPKGDKMKTQLAEELRRQTTMTVAWIAQELNAGAPQTLWGALRKLRSEHDNTRD